MRAGKERTASVAAAAYKILAHYGDKVRRWGACGELGNGTTTNRDVPVEVAGLSGVVAIAAGEYHSLALGANGTVWAWGDGVDGQLGDGLMVDSDIPDANHWPGASILETADFFSFP